MTNLRELSIKTIQTEFQQSKEAALHDIINYQKVLVLKPKKLFKVTQLIMGLMVLLLALFVAIVCFLAYLTEVRGIEILLGIPLGGFFIGLIGWLNFKSAVVSLKDTLIINHTSLKSKFLPNGEIYYSDMKRLLWREPISSGFILDKYFPFDKDLVIYDQVDQEHTLNVGLYNFGNINPVDLIKPVLEARTKLEMEVEKFRRDYPDLD